MYTTREIFKNFLIIYVYISIIILSKQLSFLDRNNNAVAALILGGFGGILNNVQIFIGMKFPNLYIIHLLNKMRTRYTRSFIKTKIIIILLVYSPISSSSSYEFSGLIYIINYELYMTVNKFYSHA